MNINVFTYVHICAIDPIFVELYHLLGGGIGGDGTEV